MNVEKTDTPEVPENVGCIQKAVAALSTTWECPAGFSDRVAAAIGTSSDDGAAGTAGMTIAQSEILIAAFETEHDPFSIKTWSENLPDALNDCPDDIPRYVRALMYAPRTWLYRQYMRSNRVLNLAIYLILSKHRALSGLTHIGQDDFAGWLKIESQNLCDVRIWLSGDHGSPVRGTSAAFLHALILRERQVRDWYSGWIRTVEFTLPPEPFSFWPQRNGCPDSEDFQIFWRALAWLASDEKIKAANTLEAHLALGRNTPQLWLLMARVASALHRFGQAEHAIGMARESLPRTLPPFDIPPLSMNPNAWTKTVDAMQRTLAMDALAHAKASPVIEASLLELAMRHGNADTAADAALCAFDARIEDLTATIRTLADREDVSTRFIQRLCVRNDPGEPDLLWDFARRVRESGANPAHALFLEALSQLDDPWTSLNTLERLIRKIPPGEDLYWNAAELWIGLQTEQQAYDEAVSGVVDSLAIEDARAVRTLILLIASLPKQAHDMLRERMIEQLGREATHRAFTRVREYTAPCGNREPPYIDWDGVARSMMPYTWQVLYLASGYGRCDDAPQPTQTLREKIMSARKMREFSAENAPSPAGWIHDVQKKASDAFDV